MVYSRGFASTKMLESFNRGMALEIFTALGEIKNARGYYGSEFSRIRGNNKNLPEKILELTLEDNRDHGSKDFISKREDQIF